LEKIIDVVISIPNVKLIIAGTGDLVNYIKNKESNNPNKIKYIGQISYFEVLRYTIDSDAIFSIRDNVPPVQKFICGSKFLEAIMAGKPFLVNSNCSAAVKVKKHKCGLIINPHNKEDFKKMILKLIDDKLLVNELGTNGRLAYNKYYSWEVMNTRLLKFYEKILI